MLRNCFPALAPLLLTLLWSGSPFPALAGSDYSLQGFIRDDEGKPLGGVEILFIDTGSRALVKSLLSDGKGRYHLSLPAGTYETRFRKVKYADQDLDTITVKASGKLPSVQMKSLEWNNDSGNTPAGGGGKDCD